MHPTIEILILNFKLQFKLLFNVATWQFRLNSKIYCPFVSCHRLELRNEHFQPNHMMSHGNQDL